MRNLELQPVDSGPCRAALCARSINPDAQCALKTSLNQQPPPLKANMNQHIELFGIGCQISILISLTKQFGRKWPILSQILQARTS
ncbi:hypothetical protein A2379_00490 [Candidatus Amesbacteria bacterium RIFOXYB1_FULL_47_13]|nr:MAG: hypothetical protein A2379_00490 [Candidatus Amesbacteria bacterium RIFOXYB1_FULL_47_13]HBC72230.1 hypothetical protein [Candidatus Amesbacteria bacterium]